MQKVVVIGSGPAAYTAALYVAEHKPLLFEGDYDAEIGPGGQLTTTTDVDNYPGYPNGTKGPELMDAMRDQAEEAGVRMVTRSVIKLEKIGDTFQLKTKEQTYEARAIILATGAAAKRLYVPGTREGEYWQKGISACAVCDGFAFKDKRVAIIGGGDSAMEEALYMSKIASRVFLIHRRPGFRARQDKLEQLKGTENIEVLLPYQLESAHGNDRLTHIRMINSDTSEPRDLEVEGLFFAIGHVPNVGFLDGLLEQENGYVKTKPDMGTSVNGIFACGDVQDYRFRQAVTAASSGCMAALSCVKYLSKLD